MSTAAAGAPSRSPTPNPERLRVGARVAFTFRRLFTAGGVHDYFWKSQPSDQEDEESEDDGKPRNH